MVHVAIAGGSGPEVAREVIDALLATNNHELTVLSRGPEVHDYPQGQLEVHTLPSFIQPLSDPNQTAQKNLIDAAITAGVKRFAPSEYGSKETANMPWWSGKASTRSYLACINAESTVMEYTLFQPGLFLNYLAHPYRTSRHLTPLQTVFDFEHRRAIVVKDHPNAIMTFTSVTDLAAIIALAINCPAKWPPTSGISGNRLTVAQILAIGERVRGQPVPSFPSFFSALSTFANPSFACRPFTVGEVHLEDLERGELKTSWGLQVVHRAVAGEEEAAVKAMLEQVAVGTLLGCVKGAWESGEEMNRLFPEYEFEDAEEFLRGVFEGKP
ncbi:hypothetical protein B9Z65_4159 [Elsinoe australis]|uniref:NmrA-like domain-containing protein n=1 Tax=Elsinoe australis TaxID=40998 RepID=A0A2P7Z204_9PEZI|nr:hypothetical protein B9Z65_4159 [Elsinoe australis]